VGAGSLYACERLEEYCDGGLVVREEDEGRSLSLHG
jgi:hypothetical protein